MNIDEWNQAMDTLGARRGTVEELMALLPGLPVAKVDEFRGTKHIWFTCPGCRMQHGVCVARPAGHNGPVWDWNGSLQAPTFMPSLLVEYDWGSPSQILRCHSYIEAGVMKFLSDCTHDMATRAVPIPPLVKP